MCVKKSFWWVGVWLLLVSLAVVGCSLNSVSETDPAGEKSSSSRPNNRDDLQIVSYPVTELNMLPAQEPTATALPNHVLVNARLVDQVFVNIYERVNPSVVNIEVVSQTSLSNSFNASGSGFVYDLDGHIVTNAHVVRDAREIIVTFSDGHVADARLVGMDDFSDLAVIRVDGERERLVPVTIGDSGQLKVGQHIVAIGNPFGLQSSMTVGYVSATGRALPSEELVNLQRNSTGRFNNPSIIQVDASINPGNSGGPVLNLDGEVVGVATAIRTETGIFQGVAFAVPSNTLKRIVPQLIADGRVRYPYIGISSPDSSNGVTVAAMAETFNFAVDSGVLVSEVLEDSPADDAGIRGGNRTETFRGQPVRLGGDIIVAVDGLFVSDLDELLAYLVDNIAPNDTVILTVVRGNETLEIPVVVGERPR